MTEKKYTDIDLNKGNLSGIKAKPITSIHHYSGRLLFGDTIKILTEMKKGDAYFNSFYDDDKGVFVNEIENLKNNQEVEYFTLPYQGGAYHHLFYLENKKKECIGFYIDTASAHFVHEQGKPEIFHSDEHANFLGDFIATSMVRDKPYSKFTSKSKSILTTECGDIVKFISNEQPCLDHKKISVIEAKKKLTELCFKPKCTFVNFVGTEKDKNSYDFYIDDLIDFKDTNFSIFKLDLNSVIKNSSLLENAISFASYYGGYYNGESNPYENQKLNEEDQKYVDNYMKQWSSEQFGKFGIDPEKLGIDTKKNHTPIERFEDYIEDHGTIMGYYFLCNSFVEHIEKLKKQADFN